MRHQKSGRKLGRTSSHRKAMFRNLTTSLLIHDRIRTTDAKAKELRKYAERMITLARKARKFGSADGDDKNAVAKSLHYRRQALQYLSLPKIDASNPDDRAERKGLLDKLFVELADKFMDRAGGYTRIIKVGTRRGDGAPLSLIEFVEKVLEESSKSSKRKTKKKKKTTSAKATPEKVVEQENAEETVEETVEETETEKTAKEQAAPEEPEAEDTETTDETAEESPGEQAEEPEEPEAEQEVEPTAEPQPESEPEKEPEESPDENKDKEGEE